MAQFDFIECAANGYKFLWHRRFSILRLATPIIGIKLITLFAVYTLNLEQSYLLHGLLFLPSSFLEGLLICILIRLEMFREPISYSTEKQINPYKGGSLILAGAITYTLGKLVVSFVSAILLNSGAVTLSNETTQTNTAEPSTLAFIVSFLTLAFILFGFRLIWAYIPIVMEIPLMKFLKKIKIFPHTIILLGVWLISTMPIMFGAAIIAQFFFGFATTIGIANQGSAEYIALLANAISELIAAIVASIAIAYALYAILFNNTNKTSTK